MTFQFKCPQGCLLEGEATQAGQTIHCPICGTLFIIPPPAGAAPGSVPGPAPLAGSTSPPLESPPPAAPPLDAVPGAATEADGPPAMQTAPAEPEPAEPVEDEERLFHIPCPNGHELETPPELLNQEVLCPHCNVQFLLREQDSREYQRRKVLEQERREQRVGNFWLNWSVVIAVLVVLGLLFLILSSALN